MRVSNLVRFLLIMPFALSTMASLAAQDTTEAARRFLREHEGRVQPLQIASARAWWDANVSGKDEDFAKKEEAENRVNETLSDSERFKELKAIHAGKISDPVLSRT